MENYSLNSKGIKQAATELINDNASNLIEYIYRQAGILEESTIDTQVNGSGAPDNQQSEAQKTEQLKAEQQKTEQQKTEQQKTEQQKTEQQKMEQQKTEQQKTKVAKEEQDKRSRSEKSKRTIFKNVEVRIGLSIRILAKTNRYYDENLINLILDDIDYLRRESDYLLSFKDPKARKAALDEEYALVQGYIDMDDTISLNQEVDTVSKMGKLASDGQCIIQ